MALFSLLWRLVSDHVWKFSGLITLNVPEIQKNFELKRSETSRIPAPDRCVPQWQATSDPKSWVVSQGVICLFF